MSEDGNRDELVLSQLREHGDTGAIPRPVTAWIYGSEEELNLIAARLSDAGWTSIDIDDQGDTCSLVAECEQPATAEAIHAMSEAIATAIAGTEAVDDGWETSVERTH